MKIKQAFLYAAALALMMACTTATSPKKEYTCEFPTGYKVEKMDSDFENFKGESAVGPRNQDNTFSSSIFVVFEPDATQGGSWGDENQLADYQLSVLGSFNTSNFDPDYQLIEDKNLTVDKIQGRSLTFEQDMWLPHMPDDKLPVRVKERSIYLHKNNKIWTITFLADSSDWSASEPDFNRFLSSFKFTN